MAASSACPLAGKIEQMWIENFPPGRNVTAQVYYDPHFIGFNNQNFDCHPEGDAILFKNSSMNFEIHARHKPVNQVSRPSVIEAIALKVKSETIQYKVDDGSFLVNGKSPGFINNWVLLPKSRTSIVMINAYTFHIYTEFGPRLTVYNCGCYNLNMTLSLPRIHAENAEPSLFGNLTGSHAQIIRATGLFLPP
jgi:hypothetical protein